MRLDTERPGVVDRTEHEVLGQLEWCGQGRRGKAGEELLSNRASAGPVMLRGGTAFFTPKKYVSTR
ncbi:MAG: hypothetical protein ACRDP8_18960 [Actinopolymorphaceae bacterium]